MTAVTVTAYQQAEWARAVSNVITAVQALASGVPLGSPQAVVVRRSGVLIINDDDLTLTGVGMTHAGFYMGGTLIYTVPWAGGYAAAGQLAFTTGMP